MSDKHEAVEEAAAALAKAVQEMRESEPAHLEAVERQDVLAHEGGAAWKVSYSTARAADDEDVVAHEAPTAWKISYSTAR